jgi:hypothetical protein
MDKASNVLRISSGFLLSFIDVALHGVLRILIRNVVLVDPDPYLYRKDIVTPRENTKMFHYPKNWNVSILCMIHQYTEAKF